MIPAGIFHDVPFGESGSIRARQHPGRMDFSQYVIGDPATAAMGHKRLCAGAQKNVEAWVV
jgi:hypothetical protein